MLKLKLFLLSVRMGYDLGYFLCSACTEDAVHVQGHCRPHAWTVHMHGKSKCMRHAAQHVCNATTTADLHYSVPEEDALPD